jgi:hypothetical protein
MIELAGEDEKAKLNQDRKFGTEMTNALKIEYLHVAREVGRGVLRTPDRCDQKLAKITYVQFHPNPS